MRSFLKNIYRLCSGLFAFLYSIKGDDLDGITKELNALTRLNIV